MAPVELKKRERTATPRLVAPTQSVGNALAGLLGVAGKAVAQGSQIHSQMENTKLVKSGIKVKQDFAAAQLEEEELTKLLSNPGITVTEINELDAKTIWGLGHVAASNRRGEVRAQTQYEATAILIDKAPDAIEARRILQSQLADTIKGMTDPAEIAGATQRFADFSPSMLEAAAQRRITRAQALDTANTDILFTETLKSNPLNFYKTVSDQVLVGMASNKPVAEVVDQATVAISNFYNSGLEIGKDNPNGLKALAAIDAILDDKSLAGEGGARTRLTNARKSIIKAEEAAISSPDTVAARLKAEQFQIAYSQAVDHEQRGEVIPEEVQDRMRLYESSVAEVNNRKRVSDNHEAPGMSGTQESRNARLNMRSVLGEQSFGSSLTDDTRKAIAAGSQYYDRAVRQLEFIDNSVQRQVALDALGEKAAAYGREDAVAREKKADDRWKEYQAQQQEFDDFEDSLADKGMPPEMVEQFLGRTESTYVEQEAKRFQEALATWGERYGVDVRNLAE